MRPIPALLAAGLTMLPSSALAWGYEGHQIVADIARAYLTPTTRQKVDAILATDAGDLTGHDMASEATWADAYRGAGHRETARWHFVDQEIDGSADLRTACFGFPAAGRPASAGPAQECVVEKIDEFAAELAAPATTLGERLIALKFLLHLVGDVHQPLHASDNRDRGGNCVLVALGGARTVNLHAFWDTAVVEAIGRDPQQVAQTLRSRISSAQSAAWQRGDAASWAQESFQVARSTAYTIGSPAGCGADVAPIELPTAYRDAARNAAAVQLEKAGVRLAARLNRALANVTMPVAKPAQVGTDVPARTAPPPETTALHPSRNFGRTPESLACSAEADARELHGDDRRRFRQQCMRERRAR